jgi:hypothetical protein
MVAQSFVLAPRFLSQVSINLFKKEHMPSAAEVRKHLDRLAILAWNEINDETGANFALIELFLAEPSIDLGNDDVQKHLERINKGYEGEDIIQSAEEIIDALATYVEILCDDLKTSLIHPQRHNISDLGAFAEECKTIIQELQQRLQEFPTLILLSGDITLKLHDFLEEIQIVENARQYERDLIKREQESDIS